MSKFIQGNKVYLRGVEVSDASDAYLSWINDPETTRGLVTGRFPSNMNDLESYLKGEKANRNSVMFAICDKESDEHIGNIKLDAIDWISGTTELGILIGSKKHRGMGIGQDVCRLVIDYAFETLNLRKVVLSVFSNNPAAIGAYEKVGFEVEGTQKKQMFIDSEMVDKIWMAVFKEGGK